MRKSLWSDTQSKNTDAETRQLLKELINEYGLEEVDKLAIFLTGMVIDSPGRLIEKERWQIAAFVKYAYSSIRERLLDDGDIEDIKRKD